MTEYIIKAIIGVLITAGLTALWICIKKVYKAIKKFIETVNMIIKVLKALAYDSLFRQCRYLDEKPELTESEHENIEHLYDAYNSLGMNGTGKAMYEEIKKKKITPNK